MTRYTMNQNKYNVGIRSTGVYIGERTITNHDLEKMSDTTDQWIYEHTGIKERRIVDGLTSTSDMMVKAGEMALRRGNILPEQVDLVIAATLSPDHRDPATSALIQARLGLKNAFSFDMNVGGCPASVYALIAGAQFIMNGQCKHVLVLIGDVISQLIDWKDRNCNYFFGDAAGAYLLAPTRKDKGLIAYHLGTDGNGYESIQIPGGGSRMPITKDIIDQGLHYAKIDGKKVKEFAVPTICKAVHEVMACSGASLKDIDWIIPHQANYFLIKQAFERLECSLDKTFINIEKYGNTAGASVPLALHEAVLEGLVQEGQRLILVSFGAGYQWGSVFTHWCGIEDFC